MQTDRISPDGKQLLDTMPDAVLLVDADGTIAFANRQCVTLLGYTQEELVGRSIELLIPSQLRARHGVARGDYLHGSVPRMMSSGANLYAIHKDGRELPVEISLGPRHLGGEQQAICCLRDITHREQLEQALAGSPSAITTFFQNAPVAMLLLDENRRVLRLNRAAKATLGVSDGVESTPRFGNAVHCLGAVGEFGECGHGESCGQCSIRQVVAQTYATGKSFQQVAASMVCESDMGKYDKHFLISTTAADTAAGRRVFVSFQDVTAAKRSELELREALAEIEQLRDQLEQENTYLREEVKVSHAIGKIVGQSGEIQLTVEKAKHVAATDANVLLLGETGTGKSLFAHVIHDNSPRRERPLIQVNCAALPASLIESELFGHVQGSFTGAISDKTGRFELANGGTIFLDEIGELTPELQAKLLHVIQEGEFERVGSAQTLQVDVRIIAATNRDLHKAMKNGEFRPDLYYRLAVFPIEIPPLRVRREDIPMLVWNFIMKRRKTLGRMIRNVPEHVMQMLIDYDWPGNVRELQNVLERAMILSPTGTLALDTVLAPSGVAAEPVLSHVSEHDSAKLALVDREHILRILDRCNWRIKGSGNAAERLGLKPSTLRYRMKKLGIQRPPRRPR